MFLDKFIDVKMTMVKIVVMTIFVVKMTMRRQ